MKLFVHTPISNRAWILPEFLDALTAQNFPKAATVLCFDENESEDDTRQMLEAFAVKSRGTYSEVLVRGWKWRAPVNLPDHQWSPERYRRMTQMRNDSFLTARRLGCDFVFSIDSDVILKETDTISHLVSADESVIAGVFMAVWGNPEADALPNVWQKGQNEMTDEFIAGISKANSHVRVGGLGACTLIRREVWEAGVNYTPLYNLPTNYRGEDRHFSVRAVAAGFPLMACAHKRIEHRDRPKN